jgi:transcriptional regulator with XRE-family HTH domain
MQEETSLEFSNRFQSALKRSGIKLKDVAAKADLSAGYISDLKSGKKGSPSREVVEKFSEILQCDAKWLFSGRGEMYEGHRQQQALSKSAEVRSAAIAAGLDQEIEAMAELYKSILYQFPANPKRMRQMFRDNINANIDQFEIWCDEAIEKKNNKFKK